MNGKVIDGVIVVIENIIETCGSRNVVVGEGLLEKNKFILYKRNSGVKFF